MIGWIITLIEGYSGFRLVSQNTPFTPFMHKIKNISVPDNVPIQSDSNAGPSKIPLANPSGGDDPFLVKNTETLPPEIDA